MARLRGRSRFQNGYIELTRANTWKAHWYVYLKDPVTGAERRSHRSKIVGTKAQLRKYEAEQKLRAIVGSVNSGKTATPDDVTFQWFVDNRWLPLVDGGWKASTAATNKDILARIAAKFGPTPIADLDLVAMQSWLNALAAKFSRSLVWHIRTFLKAICAEAVDQEFLARDPARKLKRPLTRKPDETILEWVQLEGLLAALPCRDNLLLKLAAAEAVRPGELFAFRWSCFVTLPNGRRALEVRETIHKGKLRDHAKTEDSCDYIALPLALAAELEAYRSETRWNGDNDFIFTNSRGGFINKDNYLNRVLYPLRDALKLSKLNFQILRRTFATRAYDEKKGTLKDIQKHLRHAKPDTTLENYAKQVPESVFTMVDAMYDRISAAPKADALKTMKAASGRLQ
jgi:integrase